MASIMPLDTSTLEALRPGGDFVSVAPSFFVMIVPAVSVAVGLGPAQAVCAVAWLQATQPAWSAGPLLSWMASPVALSALTLLAVVEGLWDKIPGPDRWLLALQLRCVPAVGAVMGFAVAATQPLDVAIGAALLGLMLSTCCFCCVAPSRVGVLDAGMAPFVTPIASTVQTLLIFSLVLPLGQMPIMAGVLILVVGLACGFMLLLDRRPFQDCWRAAVLLRDSRSIFVAPPGGKLPDVPGGQETR